MTWAVLDPVTEHATVSRPVPCRIVHELDEVEALVRASPRRLVLIFDVDNTLVRQGVPLDEFGSAVHAARDRFEALGPVSRVILLTNGPERGVPWMESRGNKPWTSRRRLGLRGDGGDDVWVIGDQIVTDGALAWRLRARFLHLVLDDENEAARQAAMRHLGRRLERLFFSDW